MFSKQCNEQSTHRVRIRLMDRGCYCPLHTKLLLDTFETLKYPYKIERLKTIAPPFCAYVENKKYTLCVSLAQKSKTASPWVLTKRRTYKKITLNGGK